MTKKKKILPALDHSCTLIDSHCHLDMDSYASDIGQVLDKAKANGIDTIITIGIDINSSINAIRLANEHRMVMATVGIHPHDVGNIRSTELNTISALIDHKKDHIVGYGEIGLDYVKRYSPPDIQKRYFNEQLSIAKNHNLPVIIHDRDAHDDMLTILKQHAPFHFGGVMHCFSGNIEYAKKILDLGLYISIPGIVTFNSAKDLKEVAQNIPIDSMLLETDGPFLAPSPHRGKRNEPVYLLYTADEVARLRDISINKVARETTRNCMRLFKM